MIVLPVAGSVTSKVWPDLAEIHRPLMWAWVMKRDLSVRAGGGVGDMVFSCFLCVIAGPAVAYCFCKFAWCDNVVVGASIDALCFVGGRTCLGQEVQDMNGFWL